MKVLVFGGTGLLGSALKNTGLEKKNNTFIWHGVNSHLADCTADLNDTEAIAEILRVVCPEVILNLVGMTNVDKCEACPNKASDLNWYAVRNILTAARLTGLVPSFIHISTDQVYDSPGASSENEIKLINAYAITKYAGERECLKYGGTILRTNFFGKTNHPHRKSFTDWLYECGSAGTPIDAFKDVWFSPLEIKNLARAIEAVIANPLGGIFNLGSREGVTKYDFARRFYKRIGFEESLIRSISVSQHPGLLAFRPNDMRMDSAKFEAAFGMELPYLDDDIVSAVREYQF